MKTGIIKYGLVVIGCSSLLLACEDKKDEYVDLNSGKTITIKKDESGKVINAETGEPVGLYVDRSSNDTLLGSTGAKVNGKVYRGDDGTYTYVGDIRHGEEYKIKGDDYKKKVDADGDVKIKDGDTKVKIDGETGEMEVKH